MKTFALTLSIALLSTAAVAQTGLAPATAFTRVETPAIGSLTVAPGAHQPIGPGFACPHEFICDGVEHFFHRIEGHCVNDPEQGIWCYGPEGPEVPHPE